jgi:hypothetical protein
VSSELWEVQSTSRVGVNLNLSRKPSGCVVWIFFNDLTGELDSFCWFGGKPNEMLPDLSDFPTTKHTKANAQGIKALRQNTRSIGRGKFTVADTIEDVYQLLFGS